jgi:hypothetical protein
MTPGILVRAPTTGIVDHRIGTPSLLVRPKRSISLSYRAVKNLEIYEVCSESNVPGKITSQRYMLERWHKNIYFGESYSLSESF